MKKGELPELSAKWWKASQPKGLSSGGKLELALRAHEVSVSSFKKDPKEDKFKQAVHTLDAVKDALTKTVAEAARVKGNLEMEFTVQALQKIDFKKETSLLESSVKPADNNDDDEEVDASTLKNPVAFAKVLRKGLTRVGDRPMIWGFVVGKKPIDHRFLLHRSKNGRTMAIAAAKDLGRPPKVSFGTVIRDPNDNATIILTVQGAMLAGLATRIKKMLLKLKPQPITHVQLMVDGQIVPESIDPDDVDEADDDDAPQVTPETAARATGPGDGQTVDPALERLHRRIEALEPRAAAVMEALPHYRDRVTASIRQLMTAMEAENAAVAGPLLDKLEEVVRRLENVQAQATQPSQSTASAERAQQAAAEIQGALPGNVVSAVNFAKLRLRLTAAKTAWITAGANLEKSSEALVDNGDYEDDPDLDAMRAAAGTIAQRLPRFDGVTAKVQDALDAAARAAAPTDRTREMQSAITALDDYLLELDKDEMLRVLQNTPAGTFQIYDQIANAVRDLRDALAA